MCMTIIEAKNNNLPTEYYELEVDEKLFELYETKTFQAGMVFPMGAVTSFITDKKSSKGKK